MIKVKGDFEVLINNKNGTKVEWTNWEKLVAFTQMNGAVSTINGGSRVSTIHVDNVIKVFF